MRIEVVKKAIWYTVFLLFGTVMLYLAFRDADFAGIISSLKNANYTWVLFSLLVTFLVHLMRAARWRMLIEPLEKDAPTFWFTYHVLMAGYFINTALPRVGELYRALMIQKKSGHSFSAILGTVVTERLSDLIMLGLVILVALAVQFSLLQHFFMEQLFRPIAQKVISIAAIVPFYGWFVGGFILMLFIFYRLRQKRSNSDTGNASRLERLVLQLEQGLFTITKLNYPITFIGLTCCIWIGYFFMTYLCFFATPPTAMLSIGAALAIVGIGSIGRTVPVQAGGMGAYHWIVSQGLFLYGISIDNGLVMATIIHAAQTLFYLVVGGFSLLIISLQYSNSKKA